MIAREPDLTRAPPTLNPRLTELLKRCLEKNPKRRWQAVGDLRAELETLRAAPFGGERPVRRWRRVVAYALLGAAAGSLATAAIVSLLGRPSGAPPRVSRLLITPPPHAALSFSGLDHDVAISPDGARIVYVASNGSSLFVRALDKLDAAQLPGTDGVRGPFVSPDGQWVGFFESNTDLKKVAITGGPAITVARVDGGGPHGGATIV